MYIFTDSPTSLNRLLSVNQQWKKPITENFCSPDYQKLVTQLLNTPLFTEIKTEIGWNSLIHINHSPISQYDILTKFAKSEGELPDGILCSAESGENFHGQKNRKWETLIGNIHFSIFLKPKITNIRMNRRFLISTVSAILKTIDSLPDLNGKAMVKWPNDIYIEDSKIGGILTRCYSQNNIVRAVVLGIGLNVEATPKIRSDRFTKKTSCIRNFSPLVELKTIFQKLINSLHTHYQLIKSNKDKHLYNFYCNRSLIIGRQCAIYTEDESKADFVGKVIGFGNDLELFLGNKSTPINNGRLEILDY